MFIHSFDEEKEKGIHRNICSLNKMNLIQIESFVIVMILRFVSPNRLDSL
jgi:hypothetical protein